MLKNIVLILAVLGLALFGATTAYGATLWDFVVSAKFDSERINLYEKPTITGKVLNHAMKPVPGAEVQIRFAGASVTTTTNATGVFSYQFAEQTIPGTFIVNIYVKDGEKRAVAKTTLRVGEEQVTFNELYYKSEDVVNEQDNPYRALQLKHYQKHLEEQQKRLQKQIEIESKKLILEEKRQIAQLKLEEAIRQKQPGYGIYSGYKYDDYISSLNPKAKNTITSQLNYTKNAFEEAQYAMKQVLDNGGTLQEAREAYFAKLAITKEQLESFDNSTAKNTSEVKKQDPKSPKKVVGLSVKGKKQ